MEPRFSDVSSLFLCFQSEKRAGGGVFRHSLSSQSPEMWSDPVSTAATASPFFSVKAHVKVSVCFFFFKFGCFCMFFWHPRAVEGPALDKLVMI